MDQTTEIIYTAGHIEEAVLLQQMLSERDIEAVIENEVLQGGIGGLPPGEATDPRVRVSADDAAKAREVVKAFEHQQQLARARPDDDFAGLTSDNWADWPTCPDCGRRRQTVCPICETAGTNLPLADPNHAGVAPSLGPNKEDPEGELPLLICTTCDEPFAPRFYRSCPWCNHQFEDGIALPQPAGPQEKISLQAWAVIFGITALVGGLCVYFWWITR